MKFTDCPTSIQKLGNFRENFILAKKGKRQVCDAQTSRLRHALPISVNDRVILSFREGLIFKLINSRENFRINSTKGEI